MCFLNKRNYNCIQTIYQCIQVDYLSILMGLLVLFDQDYLVPQFHQVLLSSPSCHHLLEDQYHLDDHAVQPVHHFQVVLHLLELPLVLEGQHLQEIPCDQVGRLNPKNIYSNIESMSMGDHSVDDITIVTALIQLYCTTQRMNGSN